ncbi:MCE family protein [Nocardia higoensis]|uniref:MCE family protein n=1 Tax=Nocardia higoensis TaxID=228599 RepID=A0ABS0DB49_9NOCA|nr:MlaD family protein [Nocardia higoensis]MBF6355703.1 MCE family protein [Nocardia higoensis]
MRGNRAGLGLTIFLVVSVVMTWMVFATLQRNVGGSTKTYSALFTDISGLRPGDDVRLAGIRVGRVDAVGLSGTLAEVTFRVEAAHTLTGNTKAAVKYQNIIGQRYLGLSLDDFGGPEILADGDRIPVEHTEPSFDISALLNGFEPLFSTLDPEKLNSIANALVLALQGDVVSVTQLISHTSELAAAVAGDDAVLGAVITGMDAVVTSLAQQSGNTQAMIDRAREIVSDLAARRDPLLRSVDGIADVAARTSAVFTDVETDLEQLVVREPGFLRGLLENENGIAYLGANLPLMLKGLARSFGEGSYVNFYFCDATLSFLPGLSPLVPTIVGAATPSGVPEHSAACR